LRLANAVRDAIEEHASEHPEAWLKTPAKIARGLKLGYKDGPYPLVVVSIEGSEPNEQGMSDGGPVEREALTLQIYGLAQDPLDPEGAAAELAADVRRALGLNRQLAIGGAAAILPEGYLHFGGTKLRHESPDGGNAAGECQITLTIDYTWTAATA
jgi:hypothetical protein